MMFRDSSEWVYWYEYHLNENAYVRMSFKYDSANKVFLQRDVYLYADDQEVEVVIFYRNFLPTTKTGLG